jgi:hypothetical protein
MKIDNIIQSELKVVASENLNIQKDLETQDPEKSLEKIINEQKEKKQGSKS